jgi:SAM-dependent methyltransferase
VMIKKNKNKADPRGVATEISRFYNRHPYPPPVESLEKYKKKWADDEQRRFDYHMFEPHRPYRDDRTILVAGCGTSQAAKYAVRWPNAKVTGIDFSDASIRQTEKLKQRFELENLNVIKMPIEKARELDEQFDHVVCTGVLHHLPDPSAGLNALCDVLSDIGSMHLMVYAPYGRAGVYLLQEYCRKVGIGASSKEIRDLVKVLYALPKTHPLVSLLNSSLDFKNESAIADALLNPQDRSFNVPEFFDFLDSAKLRFVRWLRQAEYLPECGAVKGTPHERLVAGLAPCEQFAAIELFRGNMLRHSAVICKNNHKERLNTEVFEGNAWFNMVPILFPNTVFVTEHLPKGAVAVLINPTHTQTDIYLPVTAEQLRIVKLIDGVNPCGEMASHSDGCESLRSTLKALWQHDLVVFRKNS